MKSLVLLTGCAVAVLAFTASQAHAIPNFQKQFLAKYVEGNSNAEFVAAVKEAKCNVCHKGKKKKDRNAYGMELSKLLDKKEDKDNVDKIQEALDKVAAMKSDPKDEKSPTFGELIKEGKLPGGAPE